MCYALLIYCHEDTAVSDCERQRRRHTSCSSRQPAERDRGHGGLAGRGDPAPGERLPATA
jgi:hypothetical protein